MFRPRSRAARRPIQLAGATALWIAIATQAVAQTDAAWVIAAPQGSLGNPVGFAPVTGNARWLALVAGTHRWTLEPAIANGQETPEPPGKAAAGTLVLLRHPALVPGPAPTPEMRFSGHPRRFMSSTPSLHVAFGAAAYEITVHDRAIWLQSGDRRTMIGSAYVDGEEFYADLIWAGDLDHDGRLDLIVEEHNGGYSADLCLYLSSPPQAGRELLMKIGCQSWSG